MRPSFVAVTVLACLQSILYANFFEKSPSLTPTDRTKIYVDPKDVTLMLDEIYWNSEGQRIPIQNVQIDENGLFVIPMDKDEVKYTKYTCPGCGRIYAWYENCSTPGCPMNR